MSEHRRDEDGEYTWLLARERLEPAPPISDIRARQYEQLDRLLAGLPVTPAGVAHRNDWERDVLAIFDAEAYKRVDQDRTAPNDVAPSATPPVAASDTPLSKERSPIRRHRRRAATAAAAAVLTVASVAFVVLRPRDRVNGTLMNGSARDVGPRQPNPGASKPPDEMTRGMRVERGPLGIDQAVQVRRSDMAHRGLRDGDTVMTGDGISASVMTSADAHLYLVFCAGGHLQTYPSYRGVRTRAGELVLVPEGGGEFVLDNQPGSEVLYLIVSRNELSVTDPDLAALITEGGDPSRSVDCASLDSGLVKSTAVRGNVLRGKMVPKKPAPRSGDSAGDNPDLITDPGDVVWYTRDDTDNQPAMPRAVVVADPDGIAIVRYRFIHVTQDHTGERNKEGDN